MIPRLIDEIPIITVAASVAKVLRQLPALRALKQKNRANSAV